MPNQGHQLLPLPPLVPERPSMPMNAPINRAIGSPTSTEKTDAEMVLSMLNTLEGKMLNMENKVDLIHSDETKHYESLRRGLRRIKDAKADAVTSSEPVVADKKVEDGTFPYCICNYCLSGIYLH
jgi:hypothetical protein